MLNARKHLIVGLEIGSLKALHPCGGEQPAEQHVLAAAFDPAAPALVARHVDHRSERPVDARARCLECRRSGCPPGKVGLKARHFSQRYREDCAVAVDNVRSEDQWDPHPRILDGRGLEDSRHAGAIPVEHAGELSAARFFDLLGEAVVLLGGFIASAVPPPQADAMRLSWPAFSSRVIFAISWSTKPGTSSLPIVWISARAGLASHVATAPAPMSTARRERRVSSIEVPSILSAPCTIGAALATIFPACLTVDVTGYMAEANGNCNRVGRDFRRNCRR